MEDKKTRKVKIIFGYVICNKNGLSKEELDRYQNVYCGLCRSLGTQFGQLERMSLSYDMTFVALFLSALYEPEEEIKKIHCPVHPFSKRMASENKYIDYAANMSIALTYYKCLDDWNDEKKRISYELSKYLQKKYEEVQQKYPRQCKSIKESIEKLTEIEKSAESIPDDAVNCNGKLLEELFVYEEDFWSSSLRNFGYELGRFIYLMDAAIDYEEDKKKGNYNPLLRLGISPKDAKPIMMNAIGNASKEFEALPIVQDVHLLRNILYGGVWQKYIIKLSEKEKKSNGK